MGKLDLEAHADSIVSLFTRDVEDESTAEVVQYAVGNLPSFCLHVEDKNIPNSRNNEAKNKQRKATIFLNLESMHCIDQSRRTICARVVKCP